MHKVDVTRVLFPHVLWLALLAVFSGVVLAQSDAANPEVILVNIVDGAVQGNKVVRVTQGQVIELRWISDKALDIHLHGYDIEKSLKAGEAKAMSFSAFATGRFPVTLHGASHSHGETAPGSHGGGEQNLIYLEVYPE